MNLRRTDFPNGIEPPTAEEIDIHLAFVEQQHLDGYAATVDHAIKRKAAFDSRLRQRAPKNVVFQPGDLVQVHATQWVHTFASIKKLIPMWSIPHHVATWKLNSYTLETLSGLPLTGVYNSRRLRMFELREGTKLAKEELAHMEIHEGDGMEREDGATSVDS